MQEDGMTSSVEQPLNTDQKTPTSRHQKEKGQSKVSKKSLGGGLTKIVRDGETISYEFRMMRKGTAYEIALGSAKDLSEEQARIEAEKCRAKILREKRKDGIKKLSGDLAKPSFPCFQSHEHARNFIKKLNQIAPANYRHFTNGDLEPIELELYGIIWLMLLLPLSMEDLLQLEMSDIHRERGGPYLILPTSEKHSPYFEVYLSNTAIKIFNALEATLSRGSFREKLFPRLNELSKSERKTEIKLVLNKISPTYTIDINKFIAFFEFTASKFSCFRSEFIKDYAKKRRLQSEWKINNGARRLLADWWWNYLQQQITPSKRANWDYSVLRHINWDLLSNNRRR